MSKHLHTPSLDYIRKLYAPQDSLLSSIDQTLNKLDRAIHVGPEEGKLLQMIVALAQARTVVEIGTLAGYSTVWLARAIPPEGHIYTLERDPESAQMAAHFFDQSEVRERITLIEGDAKQSLALIEDKGPFDMVFIDADKISYNDYLDWAENHVRPYGLIVADNTLLFDTIGLDFPPPNVAPTTWNNMRRFNERLADSTKYFSTMIPTKEGFTIAIKLF
ncbi:MAG: O-methyltransferase [Rickettsiales bacterium]|nr:O-methyltransferase [Rickettsiales bacterium]